MPWGTALQGHAPVYLNANADVTNTADATTTGIHSQSGGTAVKLAVDSPDPWILLVTGVLTILCGATKPNALVISIATTDGTPISSYTVEPGLLANNAELVIPFAFFIPASTTLWAGAGTDPLIQVAPTAQATTTKKVGSSALAFFLPAA